jgi:DNA repair protein RadA/Sms
MAKRSQYVCQQCGYSQVGWAGKCPECGSWNSLVETVISESKSGTRREKKEVSKPILLSKVPSIKTSRISTKIPELDRVLGGGLVAGQVVLLAGEPGVGKSTILLQLAQKLGKALYVSGEESANQIRVRSERLKVSSKEISILEETNVDSIIDSIYSLSKPKEKPLIIIIDSIQTLYTRDLSGMSGSVGQVRECAFRLTQMAKKLQIPLIMVGHVTKGGSVAGPATLAHIVDTVCWFEGDKDLILRILRSVKNRFGPTDEIGIFKMEDKGLASFSDIEKLFVSKMEKTVPGSVATCLMEGTRPILVEIQSLVVPTNTPYPKRIAQGIDSKRLEVLIAVLIRHLGFPLYGKDVFVNIVGGINVREPASDLAICLSIASSYLNKACPAKLVAIGEVGLLGEVRSVLAEEKRVNYARRHGFSKFAIAKKTHFLSQAVKLYLRKPQS